MNGYIFLYLGILQFMIASTVEGCAQTINVPSDGNPGGFARLRCDYTACSNVDKMVFERKDAGGNDNWREAVNITVGNSREYKTLLGGYDLTDRSNSLVNAGLFDLIIDPTEQVDSGMWRCKVLADGGPYIGGAAELRIIEPLIDENVKLSSTAANDEFVLTALYEYTCTSNKLVYPAVDVNFEVDGKVFCENEGLHTPKDYLYQFTSKCMIRSNTTDEINVRCNVGRNEGIIWSAMADISPSIDTIVYPANVENVSLSNGEVEVSSILTMHCIASGKDISIEWKQNDHSVNYTFFDRLQETVQGDFQYGQTEGLKDTLTWINPRSTDPCSNITRHDGTYVCVVNGLANTVSEDILGTVKLQYAPTVDSDGLNPEIKEGEELQIDCPLCADPSISSYQWSVQNGKIRDGITGVTTSTLYIPKVTKDDINNVFVCEATNAKGTTRVKVDIIGLIVGLSVGAIIGIVIAVLIFLGLIAGGSYFGVKKYQSQNEGRVQ